MSANPQLSSSFVKSRNEGYSDEEITKDALLAGWTQADIDASFDELDKIVSTPIIQKVEEAPLTSTPIPTPVSDPVITPILDSVPASINNIVTADMSVSDTASNSISVPDNMDFNPVKVNSTEAIKEPVKTSININVPFQPVSESVDSVPKPSDQNIKPIEQVKVQDQINPIIVNNPVTDSNTVSGIKTMQSASKNFAVNKNTPPKKGKLITTFVIIFLLFVIGGSVFAYTSNLGPFSKKLYKEDNLTSGILSKIAQIESSTYGLKFELYAKDRDADAKPFDVKIKDDPESKAKFERDSKRVKDLTRIIQNLKYSFYDSNSYPVSLKKIEEEINKYGFDDEKVSILDPLTKKEYTYNLSKDKKDFQLEVNFETKDAIKAINSSYSFSTSSTKIIDKKVVFSKDSNSYFYMKESKTFWETIDEYAEYIPNEIKMDGSIKVITDIKKSEWKIDFDGNGDFGDLTYKVNFEALKKLKDYYFRINNMPALFMGFLPPKDQWIKFEPSVATTTSDVGYSGIISSKEIAEYETKYKEQRASTVDFLKKTIKFADEEKLFAFKEKPHKEKVDSRTLYRYDLKIRKESILPFYKKMLDEASKNPEIKSNDLPFLDEDLIEFFESEEFSETFDYYDKSVQVTLWTDSEGFPAIAKYSVRVVPSDKIVSFKGKQLMFDFTLTFDDINKPVEIKAPASSKTYEEVMKEMYPSEKFVELN